MKPLIILLFVFVITVFTIKLTTHQYNLSLSARIAMCSMLIFAAMGHFAYTKGMAMMVPGFIPFKTKLVYLTGLLEILLGTGLLVSNIRVYVAWVLIVFFILILPANIKAAIEHIHIQKGTFNGPGPNYLWFRIPLQLFFIAWVYFSSIKF